MKNIECKSQFYKGKYFINDDKITKKGVFVNENEIWTLFVNASKNFTFIQNEGCVMTNNNHKKCDWICFDDINFYFIEAKDVKPSQRKKERRETKLKFKDTVDFYHNELNFNTNLEKHAILNFRNSRVITGAASKENKTFYFLNLGLIYDETNILKFN